MDMPRQTVVSSIGLLILRLGIGGLMLTHGVGKLQMVWNGDFDKFGDPIGIGSTASLLMITFAEFLCALLVIVGFAARFASIPIVIGMGVAAFIVHADDPLSTKEKPLLFLIAFLAIALTGAGRFSFDAIIERRRKLRKEV